MQCSFLLQSRFQAYHLIPSGFDIVLSNFSSFFLRSLQLNQSLLMFIVELSILIIQFIMLIFVLKCPILMAIL